MIKAGVYLRVSTREQAEHGWSIDGQYNEIRDWVDRNGKGDIRVVKRFTDAGFTANNLDRPGLIQMFEAVERDKIDALIIWKFDRLSRDNLDFPGLMYFFTKNNVNVISISEPSLDYATPYGEFIVGILGLVATLERRMNQARGKMAMKERAKEGLWHGGKPPYGYRYNAQTQRIEPDEAEAGVVRLMYETFKQTGSIKALEAVLRTNNIRMRKGTRFNKQYLTTILTRRRYLGWMWYSGMQWEDKSLQIIPTDLWEQVNRIVHTKGLVSGSMVVDADAQPGRSIDP